MTESYSATIDRRLASLETRMEWMLEESIKNNNRFEKANNRIDVLEEKTSEHRKKIDTIQNYIDTHINRLDSLDGRIASIQSYMDTFSMNSKNISEIIKETKDTCSEKDLKIRSMIRTIEHNLKYLQELIDA